jgi:hypothetical protein
MIVDDLLMVLMMDNDGYELFIYSRHPAYKVSGSDDETGKNE